MSFANLKRALTAVTWVGLVALLLWQYALIRQLKAELAQRSAEVPVVPTTVPIAPVAAGPSEELLRLRGQVAQLRQQQTELASLRAEILRLRAASPAPPASEENEASEREAFKQRAIAKMVYAKNWTLAFFKFADANNGRLPQSFEQAAQWLPAEAASSELKPEQFEVLYHGSMKNLTEPAKVILFREKEPFENFRKPGWSRTYGFADGHSEIHTTTDGDFEKWEQEHVLIAPPP